MSTDFETKRRIGAALSKLTDLTQAGELRWTSTSGKAVLSALADAHEYRADWRGDRFRLVVASGRGDGSAGWLPALYVEAQDGVGESLFPPPELAATFEGHLDDLRRAVESQTRAASQALGGFMDRILGD